MGEGRVQGRGGEGREVRVFSYLPNSMSCVLQLFQMIGEKSLPKGDPHGLSIMDSVVLET